MNRREFLKSLAAVGVCVVGLPTALMADVGAHTDFDPTKEIRCEVVVTDFFTKDLVGFCRQILDPELERQVPPIYRKQVEWFFTDPRPSDYDPLSQRGKAGWVYKPVNSRRK